MRSSIAVASLLKQFTTAWHFHSPGCSSANTLIAQFIKRIFEARKGVCELSESALEREGVDGIRNTDNSRRRHRVIGCAIRRKLLSGNRKELVHCVA